MLIDLDVMVPNEDPAQGKRAEEERKPFFMPIVVSWEGVVDVLWEKFLQMGVHFFRGEILGLEKNERNDYVK